MTNTNAAAPEPARKPRTWWRMLQIVFLVAAFAYFAIKIAENWTEFKISASNVEPVWAGILGASVIVLGTYALLIQSWRMLINGSGSSLDYVPAVRIWTIANLGRYIPGKVASIAALGVLAAQEGVSGAAAASAAILGTLINIGAGFGLVAVTGSQVLDKLGAMYRSLAVLGSVAFVVGIVALPWILPPTARWLARRVGRGPVEVRVDKPVLWMSVTINVLSWFLYGWAFKVFALSVFPGVQGSTIQFVAVWTASYLVGYLAFFAPGGIGAREFAMVAGLTTLGMTDAAGAGVVAVSSRLWLSVLELLPGLLALLFSSGRKASAKAAR